MPNYSPKFGDKILHNGYSKIYMGDQSGWLTLVSSDGSRELVLPSEVDLNVPSVPQEPTVASVTVQAPTVPTVTPESTSVAPAPKAVKVPRYTKEAK